MRRLTVRFAPMLAALALLSPASCHSRRDATTSATHALPATPALAAGKVAAGRGGAVATAHPLASEAALDVLRDGGNAVDAAVAASFAISVVRPQSTGLGGGGFLLTSDAKGREIEAYDFRERAPEKATKRMFLAKDGKPKSFTYGGKTLPDASVNGHLAVGMPGLVAGLAAVHKRYGKLPWARLVEPAARLAEEGFSIYPGLASELVDRREVLAAFPATRAVFFVGDAPRQAGELLVQKDLARTLRTIAARGADGFYAGPVRDAILAEMRAGGGLLTAADFAAYEVKRRAPVSGEFRGHRVVSMPPPSSGGVHVLQILGMLAGDDLRAAGQTSPTGAHLMAEAMRRAFADRARWLGDPDFVPVPLAGLLDPAYIAARRRTVDLARATPSADVPPGCPRGAPCSERRESPSTTHISVVDADGRAVATTQTINYSFGSGVVAAGTGVLLNDEMDDFSISPGTPNVFGLVGGEQNAVAARKTMLSSMSPTLVFAPDGELVMAVGSPGGPRIISATLQTVVNVLAHGMSLPESVAAPRLHHQWLPDELRLERDVWPEATRKALTLMGHKLREAGPVGDVQAVMRKAGNLTAVSDPRAEGEARAL